VAALHPLGTIDKSIMIGMRRKDGKPKLAAKRNLPVFQHGFARNPANQSTLNPFWLGNPIDEATSVVSFFSGCGGLELGLLGGFQVFGQQYEALPFSVQYAADNSEDAVTCFKLNLGEHIFLDDLTSVDHARLPRAELLIGGFPCQDFSSSGSKTGFSGERGMLYLTMIKYLRAHKPMIVLGENVAHLGRLASGAYLKRIVADVEAQGYRVEVWEIYGPDFGLPQSRRRLFIVGVRADLPGFPSKPKATHSSKFFTIDEALSDLEGINSEQVCNQSQFFVATRATSGGGQGDHRNRRGEVSYCIRANSRGRIQFHYSLPRRLTVRECARLQSFPDSFVFPFTTQRNLTLIGNAVPPIVGHVIGKALASYFSSVKAGYVEALHTANGVEMEPVQLSLVA